MSDTLTETRADQTRRRLKTPRAAAIAGILFAVLHATSLVLIRRSIPPEPGADFAAALKSNSTTIALALNLIPFAGIAFLWFIGVIRDRLADNEDRLFATVFLGSGLLFLGLTFVGAAMAGGLLSSYAEAASTQAAVGIISYGRAVMYQVVNIYAIRMAGVFMISLGTIWLRTGAMHRAWAFLTYILALVLLVSIGYSLLVTFIFPAWVFVVSVSFLIMNFRSKSQEEMGTSSGS